MENTLGKTFINNQLGIKLNSYIDNKCQVWFKAKEVAEILGYKKTENAIKRHVSENHKRTFLLSQPVDSTGQVIKDNKSLPIETGGQVQYLKSCHPETGYQVQGRWIIFIDEAGFYELVFRSRLPAAKMFRQWVFSKVLPSIRKYGYFKMLKSKLKQRVLIDKVKYYKHPVFSNYAARKNGEVINVKTGRIIKMINNGKGYLFFNICDEKLEKPKIYYQHRFVYEVFRGPIPRCFEVDHINEIKKDNKIKNLQLLTHKQNVKKSKSKPIISINIETGEERRFISIQVASNELKINYSHISKICRKRCKTASSKKDGHKYTFKYLD